jgi:hypothetical protein
MIIFSFVYLVEKIDRQKPLHLTLQNHIIYINSVSLCVYDEGFGGWGKGEAGEATSDFFRISINSVSLFVEVLKPRSQIVKVK